MLPQVARVAPGREDGYRRDAIATSAADLTKRFATLNDPSLTELVQLPALLAYERGLETDPLFGRLRRGQSRPR